MRSIWTAGWLIAVCVGGTVGVFAQSLQVQTRAETPLRIGTTEVSRIPQGEQIEVQEVQGDWLWVRTPTGEQGWVAQTAVQLLMPISAPPGPPGAAARRLYLIGWLGADHVMTLHQQLELIAELQRLNNPQDVDRLVARTRSLADQITALRRQVQANLSSDTESTEAQTRSGLLELLDLLEAETLALQKHIQFALLDTRNQFLEARRRFETRQQQLATATPPSSVPDTDK